MNSNVKKIINSYYSIRLRKIDPNKKYDDTSTIYYNGNVYGMNGGNLCVNGKSAIIPQASFGTIMRCGNMLYGLLWKQLITYEIDGPNLTKSNIISLPSNVDDFVIGHSGNIVYRVPNYIADRKFNMTFSHICELMRNKIIIRMYTQNVIKIYDINTGISDFIVYKNSFKVCGLDTIYIDGCYYEI